jgi:hypothetical protein
MSMVICPRHGGQISLHISRDLEEVVKSGGRLRDFKKVTFTFLGKVEETFLVSQAVAIGAGLEAIDSMELPDQYPEWVMDSSPVCVECIRDAGGFESVQGGHRST